MPRTKKAKEKVDYEQLATRLADLIADPDMPPEAAELFDEAATEFINTYGSDDPDFVRRHFADACENHEGEAQ